MAEETTRRTIANFNNGVGGKFPLDTEGLTALQNNERLLAAIGALGGDLYILSGCEDNGKAGYVFVKDTDGDYPLGEVLRVEEGQPADTLCLVTEGVDVTAEQVTYTGAYTTRHLEWGTGTKMYNYSAFKKLDSVATMMETIAALRQRVEEIQPEAIGTIKMWPSATTGPGNIPLGSVDSKWKLCNGTECATEWTKLKALLGSNKLPDMSGLFVVGYSQGHSEYGNIVDNDGEIKKRGGEAAVRLEHKHLPSVTGHFYTVDKGNSPDGKFTRESTWATYIKGTDHDDSWGAKIKFDNGGQSVLHENRPPFIVMAYIIKVKD